MKNVILLFSMLLFASYTINAQIVVYDTLYPTQDATVSSLYPDSNFGQSEYFTCTLSNVKPYPYTERSFMQFDLSAVPSDAPIVSARLYLFGLGHSGRNESFLNMVKTPWQEMLVTEKNQPELLDYRITLPQSTSSYEDYVVEIREFVTRWISGLEPNNGIALRLAAVKLETVNGLKFGSREMHDPTKRPYMVLRVEYQEVPKTTISSNLCFTTDLPLKTQITADKVYKAEQYEFMIFNQTTGNTDIITTSSNSFNLTDMPTPVGYNTVYDIQVRVMVGGQWGSFGEKCRISTVKMAQAEPCDTTMLSHQFSGVDGGVVSIAVPSGITLLNSASVNPGTVSVNLIDPQHAEYTCNNSSFTLFYSVVAGCETFNKNTYSIIDTLNYTVSGTPYIVIDTISMSSPWIVFADNQSQNIQYNDAFINQPVIRTFAFVNTGTDFTGDLEFTDTLNVAYSVSALRFDTVYAPVGATILSQTVSDNVVHVKLGNLTIDAGDTMYIQDVITLIKCPDGVNSKTTFDLSYGCEGSSLCAQAEIPNHETVVYESPDDRPILNYVLLTKGYPVCWGEPMERIIKIENTGLVAADSVRIHFLVDQGPSPFQSWMTYQPLDSIVIYRSSGIPVNYTVNYYGWDQYIVMISDSLDPNDSLFFRYVTLFDCINPNDISYYSNQLLYCYTYEFPGIQLIHQCNTYGIENPTGVDVRDNVQNEYSGYGIMHILALNQNFLNYNATMMDGDENWFDVSSSDLNLANTTNSVLSDQQGFIFDVPDSRIKVMLTLESGFGWVPGEIYIKSDNPAFGVINADSTELELDNPSDSGCGGKVYAWFKIPDTFYEPNPTNLNGFKYITTNSGVPGEKPYFDQFFNSFRVFFKLKAACHCAVDGKATITENVLLVPNITCGSECAVPLSEVSTEVNIHCPGCLLPGWNIMSAELKRINFGDEDNNNNNFHDSYSPFNPADTLLANYHNAIDGDILRIRLTALTSDGDWIPLDSGGSFLATFSNVGFDYICGQLALKSQMMDKLQFLNAYGQFTRGATVSDFALPAEAGSYYSNGFALSLDVDTLTKYGADTSIHKFEGGDFIKMDVYLKVKDNLVNPSAPNPYFSIEGMNAVLNMSGSPFTGIDIKPDASTVENDTFATMTPAERQELQYWCTGWDLAFGAVGFDFQSMYSPMVSYTSNIFYGDMYSPSPCVNVLRFRTGTELGHELYDANDGDQNSWNMFSYEIRDLWMLDSINITYPQEFELQSVQIKNMQLTQFGGGTQYTPIPAYSYNMSDVTMYADTSCTIFPKKYLSEITSIPYSYTNYNFGWDETKRYDIVFLLKAKDCTMPAVYPAAGVYPVTSYWSDFPGTASGDTIIQDTIRYGDFTKPQAGLLANQSGLTIQDQANSTVQFSIDIKTDSSGMIYGNPEYMYQYLISANTFIGFQSPNITVDTVYYSSGNYSWGPVNYSSTLIPYSGMVGGVPVYELGFLSYAPRTINVMAHYNCAEIDGKDSIKVYYGWNCAGYPDSTLYNTCSLDSMWVDINVLHPGLMAQLNPFGNVNACDTILYSLHISATDYGQVDSITVVMPQMPVSFDYVTGSGLVTYNSNTQPVQDSVTTDSVYFFPGRLSLLDLFAGGSSFDMTFRIVPHCGFIQSTDEVELYTSAQNYCGNPMGPIFQSGRPDEILGLPLHDSLIVQITGDTISGCGDTVHIVVTVYNAGTQNTSLADYTDIVLPTGFAWSGGDVPSGVAGQVLTFALSGNTAPGNSDNLNFTITGSVSAGNYSLPAAVYSVQTLICNSDTCYFTQAFAEDSDTAEVIVIPISLSTTTNDASCINACNGNSTAIVSGQAPFTYQWSNGDNTPTADSLCVGTYYLTVSDENGCSLIDTVSVSGGDVGDPNPFFTISSGYPCLQAGDFLSFDCPDTNVTSWFWDFGDGTTSTLQNPTHMYQDFGYYCVKLDVSGPCGTSTTNKPFYIQSKDCPCDTTFDIKNGWLVQGNDSLSDNNFGHYVVKVHGDIVIPSGATLYIHSAEVQMDPTSSIIVQRGGKLTLVDCILTSLNNCGMWPGIEVWGYGDSSSYVMTNGRVELLGAVFIKNAHIGILSGKRNFNALCEPMLVNKFDFAYSGGLVIAKPVKYAATFTNNGIDIDFIRKTNTNGGANRINNLQFVCTTLPDAHYLSTSPDPYPNVHNPWTGNANPFQRSEAGILMENLSGPNIRDCLFRNKQNGILSFDSKYNVYGCNFRRMIYGIRIENTTTSVDNRHEIANCTFDSIPGVANAHGCGIKIRGGRFDFVHDNRFGDPLSITQTENAFAIRTDDANSFNIGENQVNGFKTGVFVRNTGLNSSYVGALSPDWLGNRYNQCRTNIQTIGNNSKLKLKCNMCNNPSSTLYQVNFNNSNGILSQQGSPAPPFGSTNFKMKFGAGNEFAPPITGRKRIESISPYNYYRQSDPPAVIPETYTSIGFINVHTISSTYITKGSNDIACPSPFGVIPAEPVLNLQVFPFKVLDSLDEANEVLKISFDQRTAQLDGNATGELLADIYSDPPPGQLKNKLLAHSPLSDTVLIALIDHFPLSVGDYKTVMLANLPVSDHVAPWFYERLLLLPPGIDQQLVAAQAINDSAICPTAIEREMKENTISRGLWQNDLIITLTDTLNNNRTAALTLLERDTAVASRQVLAGTYLMEANYTKANGKLDTIALSSTVLDEWVAFTQFLGLKYSGGENLYDLDSVEIEYIRELAYACPENSATPFAQSVLYMLFREETPDCDEFETRSLLSYTSDPFSVTERMCDAIVYEYYPSPASGQVSIPYYLPENSEAWMVITDAMGHDIAVFELQIGRNELHTDVSGYAAGTYFYGIRTLTGNCSFHQMVILK